MPQRLRDVLLDEIVNLCIKLVALLVAFGLS
jgi:hypothetical protein